MIWRALLLLPLLWPLQLGCSQEVVSVNLPVDLDRQCMPERVEMACREGLRCVRLFVPQVIADGGVAMVGNYTCRVPCTTEADCPKVAGTTYVCFQPGPAPMTPVCVRQEVAERLQMDGGM